MVSLQPANNQFFRDYNHPIRKIPRANVIPNSILSVVMEDPESYPFYHLAYKAGLDHILEDTTTNYTVFVPTELQGHLDKLQSREIVKNCIYQGLVDIDDMIDRPSFRLPMISKFNLKINYPYVGLGKLVTKEPIKTINGYIYKVDMQPTYEL